MVSLVVIFLCGLLSSAICNPNTFEYTDNCAPPEAGFNSSTTGDTTPAYDTLLPIERCCPLCDQCNDLGGSCILKWARELYPQCCDFHPVEPCKDYSCECCIRCADDTCSPCIQTGGECRTECRPDELEDKSNLCSFPNNGTGPGCKCCKRCEATSECSEALGTCVTNPDDCPHGTFASTGCCGGCYCCKSVLEIVPGGICDATSGCYCSDAADCATGYYASYGECSKTVFNAGLQGTILGYGCVPKATGAPAPGRIESFLRNQAPMYPLHQNSRRQHPRQLLG